MIFAYLSLLGCSLGCFYLAWGYFDAGLMFMAIGSGNPHPTGGSEYVRAMNDCMIFKAKTWSGIGLVFLCGTIVSVIVGRRGRKRNS
jgi:hypothetical protein